MRLVVNNKSPYDGVYQIWYDGKVKGVEIEATSTSDVLRITEKAPRYWRKQRSVTLHAEPRSTRPGDVIVDPRLDAWQVDEDKESFTLVERPAPVEERAVRERIESPVLRLLADWCKGMLDERPHLLDRVFAHAREFGYAGFWRQYMRDPECIAEFPDPAARARMLWEFWEKQSAAARPEFDRRYAEVSTERLRVLAAMEPEQAAKAEGWPQVKEASREPPHDHHRSR